MAPTSSALVLKDESESPYVLNSDQVFKASTTLLKHVATTTSKKAAKSEKKNLLEDAEDSTSTGLESTPIWLNITTKTHVSDAKRLKPKKLTLPNPFVHPAATTVCLITADPQRTYKDLILSADSPIPFPELQGGNVKITRVIGVTKLKAKYHQYEAQRQLRDEHDIFLADDRIITRLPQLLGKVFYKSSLKRPIPVSLSVQPKGEDGKRLPSTKNQLTGKAAAGSSPATKVREAKTMHAEIEKTLNSALFTPAPSTNQTVRIGYASWTASQIAENITGAALQIIEKHIPNNWSNVRAMHIKGPETVSLPIWLASELWVNETMVLEHKPDEVKQLEEAQKAEESKVRKTERKNKRKLDRLIKEEREEKRQKGLPEGDDGNLDMEIEMRKEKLRKQQEEAGKEVEEDVSALSISSVKTKGGKVKKSKSMDVSVGA